jgi:putative endonuclease
MSREAGNRAEAAAAYYLQSRGFEILCRNYTIRGAEVDIIAKEGDFIVFVEVKHRKSSQYALPRESVTLSKQRRICMAALRGLQENELPEANVRFDVVESGPSGITLLRGAFAYTAEA